VFHVCDTGEEEKENEMGIMDARTSKQQDSVKGGLQKQVL
jgi:hypothetical protein